MNALTGIRGLAALWVVAYHFSLSPLASLEFQQVFPIAKCGYLGVDLFFLLSGFILTHVHGTDTATLSLRRVAHFWGLRLARIYPVHLAMLCALVAFVVFGAAIGVVPHHPEDFRARDFFYSLLLVQAWGVADDIHWNFPAWSISCEWLVYLLFPLVALAVARVRSVAGAALLLGADAAVFALVYRIVFRCDLNLRFDEGNFARFALLRIGFEFVAGALAHKIVALGGLRRWPWTIIVIAGLGACVAASFTPARDFLIVCECGLAILAGAFSATLVARLLSLAPLLYLGEISYSIYMVHIPIRMTVGRAASAILMRTHSPVTGWLVAAALFLVTVGAAAAVHALIEVPARGLLRGLMGERGARAAAVPGSERASFSAAKSRDRIEPARWR